MNYLEINPNDLVNGEGISLSLFVSGCDFHCEGCFNDTAWYFTSGKPFQKEDYEYIRDRLTDNNIIRNFSILGGEPLHPLNRVSIYNLCIALKKDIPELKIYLWTGYTMEEVQKEFPEILTTIDVLIDGRYEQSLRDITLKLRGSSNQNIWRKNSQGRFSLEDELI